MNGNGRKARRPIYAYAAAGALFLFSGGALHPETMTLLVPDASKGSVILKRSGVTYDLSRGAPPNSPQNSLQPGDVLIITGSGQVRVIRESGGTTLSSGEHDHDSIIKRIVPARNSVLFRVLCYFLCPGKNSGAMTRSASYMDPENTEKAVKDANQLRKDCFNLFKSDERAVQGLGRLPDGDIFLAACYLATDRVEQARKLVSGKEPQTMTGKEALKKMPVYWKK